jgi:hypothetical protein
LLAGGVILLELLEALALRRECHDAGAGWRRYGAGAERERRDKKSDGCCRAMHGSLSKLS